MFTSRESVLFSGVPSSGVALSADAGIAAFRIMPGLRPTMLTAHLYHGALVALLLLPGAAVDAQETADPIICTARITIQVGGGEAPFAVAVKGDKVMAVGSGRELPPGAQASSARRLAPGAHVQPSRAAEIAARKADKATQLHRPVRDRGEQILDRVEALLVPQPPDISPILGSIRPGSGLAPGAAYWQPVRGDGLWVTKGQASPTRFVLADTALTFDQLAAGLMSVGVMASWEDAPDLPFFGLASADSDGSSGSYGRRTATFGARALGRPAQRLALSASVGYLGIDSRAGRSTPTIGDQFGLAEAPGQGTHASWVHGSAAIRHDTRESPGYTRSGALRDVTWHVYRDEARGRYSFTMLDVDLRQYVPVFHEHWVIALQANAQTTDAAQDQTIPHYLLPYVGGGDSLRGFQQYRFVDWHRLLLRGELRWTPSRILDMALFLDSGKAVAARRHLDLHDLETAWGIGVRFHGPAFTALRVDVARSREGWRLHVSTGPSF